MSTLASILQTSPHPGEVPVSQLEPETPDHSGIKKVLKVTLHLGQMLECRDKNKWVMGIEVWRIIIWNWETGQMKMCCETTSPEYTGRRRTPSIRRGLHIPLRGPR
jgi:hypothetical protein